LEIPQACYICKEPYRTLDPSYSQLCPPCARLNLERRELKVDLRGHTALLTGGRLKIGYASALRLLRAGAQLFVSSRAPEDAARRYAQELDFKEWSARLEILPLDLREVTEVKQFAAKLRERLPHLDILIHNAAQTLREPTGTVAPSGELKNSWISRFEEISSEELREVFQINVIAPFVLSQALLPLMRCSPHPARFIINVTGVEGQFSRRMRSIHHVHTNMAKAALNMMTRTSARELRAQGIQLLSVDAGWVSFQNPQRDRPGERFERPPLNFQDAAARICDPIFSGIKNGQLLSGVLLKDYAQAPW